MANGEFGNGNADTISYCYPVKSSAPSTNISLNGSTDQVNIVLAASLNGNQFSFCMPVSLTIGDNVGICFYKTDATNGTVAHYNITLIKVKTSI